MFPYVKSARNLNFPGIFCLTDLSWPKKTSFTIFSACSLTFFPSSHHRDFPAQKTAMYCHLFPCSGGELPAGEELLRDEALPISAGGGGRRGVATETGGTRSKLGGKKGRVLLV